MRQNWVVAPTCTYLMQGEWAHIQRIQRVWFGGGGKMAYF